MSCSIIQSQIQKNLNRGIPMPDQTSSFPSPSPTRRLATPWQVRGRSGTVNSLFQRRPRRRPGCSRCPDLADRWTSVAALPLWREPLALPAGNPIKSPQLHGFTTGVMSQNCYISQMTKRSNSGQSFKAHLVSPTAMIFQPLSLPCKIQVLHQQPG